MVESASVVAAARPSLPGREIMSSQEGTGMSQTDTILRLLVERGDRGITPLDALEHARSLRLAARIKELRDQGLDIETRRESHGDGVHARYVLHPDYHLWSEAELREAYGR